MNDERLCSLEMQVTYLEKTLRELNEEFISQAKTITKMQRQIEQLHGIISEEDIRGNEKPPHY